MKNPLKAFLLILDEALLVAIVLVILWKVGVHLSPAVIIIVIALLVIPALIIYKAIVRPTQRRPIGGREGMIGLHGKVVTPLAPGGVIKIRGESWKATCTNDNIDIHEEVVVVGIEGLSLVVKRKTDAREQTQAL